MSYAKARSDFEYLETIALLDDQVELDAEREALMQNPTRQKAGEMYENGISLWFYEHDDLRSSTPRVKRIAERYGV